MKKKSITLTMVFEELLAVEERLKSEINTAISASEYRQDKKLEEAKRELDENARKYRDEILTRMGRGAGELQQIREDQVL